MTHSTTAKVSMLDFSQMWIGIWWCALLQRKLKKQTLNDYPKKKNVFLNVCRFPDCLRIPRLLESLNLKTWDWKLIWKKKNLQKNWCLFYDKTDVSPHARQCMTLTLTHCLDVIYLLPTILKICLDVPEQTKLPDIKWLVLKNSWLIQTLHICG